jgi:hypothetical protein
MVETTFTVATGVYFGIQKLDYKVKENFQTDNAPSTFFKPVIKTLS